MTAPERIWTAPTDGKCHVGFDTPSLNYTTEYVRADLAAIPAQGGGHEQDLIIRDLTMMLIRASRHVPDDQMAGVFDYMRRKGIDHGPLRAAIEPQPDPRDAQIAALVEALRYYADPVNGENGWCANASVARSALAAVKGGVA